MLSVEGAAPKKKQNRTHDGMFFCLNFFIRQHIDELNLILLRLDM